MSRLLQLPRELRDEIIAWVAFTPDIPPEPPKVRRNDNERWHRLGVRGTRNGEPQDAISSVLWQSSPRYGPTNNTLGLLLVNQQLNGEVQELLRARAETNVYYADIMDVDFAGPRVWVSWLCVPCKRAHIDTLNINMRLFERYMTDERPDEAYIAKRFLYSDMSMSYRLLLASILQHGPGAGTVTRLDYEAEFSVRRVIFNFQSPSKTTACPPYAWNTSGPLVLGPSADGLHGWLNGFLRGGQAFQDGRIMHQGVGEMEIRVDGELRHTINVTDAFCRLPNADNLWPLVLFEHRWEFESWVHGTIEKRKRWGLWDDSAQEKLLEEGEPDCGLLIPGLWWTLIEDDWRTTRPVPVSQRSYAFSNGL